MHAQKEIIEEYKKMRKSYEEQLLVANKLRDEKNKLLQELCWRSLFHREIQGDEVQHKYSELLVYFIR